ncbi:MAG: hypothetical protein V1844_12565 [Pseudomonadota bacterium]
MEKNSSKQITDEIRFSFETFEPKNVSLSGEFNKWGSDVVRDSVISRDESPAPQNYSQMAPFSSRTRGDEPNSFHF